MLASKAFSSLSNGLSFELQLAGESAPSDSKENAGKETQVSLDLTQALPQFLSQLRDRLGAAGVDLSQSFTLKDDGMGAIVVEGEHSDRLAIEYILSQDPKLNEQFQAIAAATSEKRQADPSGAENRFGEFRLTLANGAANIHFE